MSPLVKIVTVSSKGQVTVPKAILEQLYLRPGDTLQLDVVGNKLAGTRLGPSITAVTAGSLRRSVRRGTRDRGVSDQ